MKLCTLLLRVSGQDGIEFGPFHFESIGLGVIVCLCKMEHLRPAKAMRYQLGTVLDDADLFHIRQHTEPSQHGNGLGKQRLPDVESRMRVLFQNVNVPALFGEQRRNCGACRSTSDHQHVTRCAGLDDRREAVHLEKDIGKLRKPSPEYTQETRGWLAGVERVRNFFRHRVDRFCPKW
jgi:hypothetical protein